MKVPGIGKKTAERLLLELKGKLGPDLSLPAQRRQRRPGRHPAGAGGPRLQRPRGRALALKSLPADVGVSDGIKLALKALAK